MRMSTTRQSMDLFGSKLHFFFDHVPPEPTSVGRPHYSADLVARPLMPRSSSSSLVDTGVAQPTLSQMFLSTFNDRPFVCDEPDCGRRFNRKFTLREHKKTHTGEKPYVCPISECSRRFSTSGNLARHKRLHASLKPFTCDINGCKRSFPSQEKLDHHIKIHTGQKIHMCRAKGCTKAFSTAGNLTRHIKTHHPELIMTSYPSYSYARPSPVPGLEPSPNVLPAHHTDHTPSPKIISALVPMIKMEPAPQAVSSDSVELSYELSGFHMTYAFATKSARGMTVDSVMESAVSDIARCGMSVLDEVIEFELNRNDTWTCRR